DAGGVRGLVHDRDRDAQGGHGVAGARLRTVEASRGKWSRSDRKTSGDRNPPAPGSSEEKEFWNSWMFLSLSTILSRPARVEGLRHSLMAWQYSPMDVNRSSALTAFSSWAPMEVLL